MVLLRLLFFRGANFLLSRISLLHFSFHKFLIFQCKTFKVIYWSGYGEGAVPADLSAACLELASWNMSRYKGRRVGMTGNIKGAGVQGEHFEMSIPENVRILLEPYKRRVRRFVRRWGKTLRLAALQTGLLSAERSMYRRRRRIADRIG
jgi:hypothetical protein